MQAEAYPIRRPGAARPERGSPRRGHLLAGLVLTTALAACGGDLGPPEAEAPAPMTPDRSSIQLLELPRPALEGLPKPGREAIEAQREQLDAALAASGTSRDALADAFGQTGRIYHAHERYAAAEPAYLNAEALAPERFDWPYLLGHLYRMSGRHAEAVEAFERALRIDPDHVPARIWQAESLTALEDLEAAEAAARAALEVDPRAAPAMITLARITSQRGDAAETVELLEQAREIAPEASEINYPLGLAYRALGDETRAAGFLAQQGGVKARLQDPVLDGLDDLVVSAGAALNRGTRALAQGRADEAEREFRSAIALEPDNIRGYTNLSVVLAGKGDGPGAMAALESALAIEPENAKANFNLASLLARFGRPEEAEGYFEAALASEPDYGEAHFNYANALVRLDRPADAAVHYARLLELDPGNRDAHLMLGMLLARLERWDEALEALEAAHAALPEDAIITNSLARVLSSAPDAGPDGAARALALTEALVASERSLNHGEAHAMALAAAGRFEEAVEIQTALIAAAEDADRPDLGASLALNLSRYAQGLAASAPWTPDDPNLPGLQ